MPIITMSGKVTHEPCPVCGKPDMKVEHGRDEHDSNRHIETCSECGESLPIVCYDCPDCLPPCANCILQGWTPRGEIVKVPCGRYLCENCRGDTEIVLSCTDCDGSPNPEICGYSLINRPSAAMCQYRK